MKHRNILMINVGLCLVVFLGLTGCATKDSPTDPGPPTLPSAEWRLTETGITNTVRAFAANDTMAVAVGDGGIIFSSNDGHQWTEQRENAANDALSDIIWTGERFIAVGWNATLIYSPDAITWTWVGIGSSAHLYGVAASDSLVIAVGSSSNVYSSPKGVVWSSLATGITGDVHDVIHANERWLIGADGGIWSSGEDSLVWVPQSTVIGDNESVVALAASESLFYALIREDLFGGVPSQTFSVSHSADGLVWFHLDNLDARNIWDIHWTGDALVAVGEGNNYHLGLPDGLVFSSTGGSDFVQHTTEAPFSLAAAVNFDGELLVGGSAGYLLGGPDAADLSIRTSGAGVTGAIWNGTEYVAVTERGTVLKSADGEDWTETHSQVTTQIEALACSGQKYVTFGGPGAALEIFTSTDADTWVRTQEFEDVVLQDIVWGGNKFVVCGQKGAVYVSTDGDSWDRQFVGDDVQLRSVCYDGTRFLAAAKNIVYTSINGTDWTKPEIDSTDTEPVIDHIVWTGSQYATAGVDGDGQGYVHTSNDAIHWTEHQLEAQDGFNDFAWNGGQFVICGGSGMILTSSNAEDWTTVATGTEEVLMTFATHGGQTVVMGGYRTILVNP